MESRNICTYRTQKYSTINLEGNPGPVQSVLCTTEYSTMEHSRVRYFEISGGTFSASSYRKTVLFFALDFNPHPTVNPPQRHDGKN